MTEQIVDIIEANMPCSSDVANVAYGAGAAAGGDMARTVATSVATTIASDMIRTDTAEVKKELRDGLSAKVDRHGSGQVTMLNLANDVKQAMGGGGVHIWDETTDDLEAEIASATRFGYRRQTAVSLLDLDDPHASGVYVLYSNGNVLAAPGGHPLRVYVLPVRPGTLYMTGDVGNQGVHLVFATRYVDPTMMHAGDHVAGYISGRLNGTPNYGQTYEIAVPDGARFLIISSEHMDKLTISQTAPVSGADRVYHDEAIDGLLDGKLDARHTRNMFDPADSLTGFYASYNTGNMLTKTDWSVTAIRVTPGMHLSFNSAFTNSHVAFMADWLEGFNDLGWVAGAHTGTWVDGFYNDAKQGHVVPDGAHMMLVSMPTARLNLVQVEEGDASSAYVPAKKGILMADILDAASQTNLTVGPGRAYTTISEAVAAASDSDEILVYPGVYDESVHAWGKRVRIRGTSKRDCILTHSALNYPDPPLEMSHGELANLTIRGTNTGTQTGEHHAYCMHVEDNTCNGSSLLVQDVIFENAVHACVGIGLRNHYTLEFRGCEFHATGATNEAVYCHDHETTTHGEDDQHLAIIDCSLETAGGTVIKLQSQEINGNHATLTAQRNILVNHANPANLVTMSKWAGRDEGQDGLLGSYAWSLDATSRMNTADVLNAAAA